MTEFINLPPTVREFIGLWSLIIIVLCIINIEFAYKQKQRRLFILSILVFIADYLVFQISCDITIRYLDNNVYDTSLAPEKIPYYVYIAVLTVLSIMCGFLFVLNLRWRNSHITKMSIKESIDELPAGLCYYLNDGRCILKNHKMNNICFQITGQALLNGIEFYDAIKGRTIIQLNDGTVRCFRHRTLDYNGEPLNEVIADDITELYQKTDKLRKDNEHMQSINENLRAYGKTIDDTVRRQEILQAKINIHNGMNNILLSTLNAMNSEDNKEERDIILKAWKNNALLLSKEADTQANANIISDLNTIASLIGIKLIWVSSPDTDYAKVSELFTLSAQEAMTNAVKHANAKHLYIEVSSDESTFTARFTNDGQAPKAITTENGGLKNLRNKLEQSGGSLNIEISPQYKLEVTVPKGGIKNAI